MSIKSNRAERSMLKGSQKKNCFEYWRLVTSGFSRLTGEERIFFFDFIIVNPALSPKECVLGFKDRSNKTAQDLHYALTGSAPVQNVAAEEYVQPSYGLVKAGVLGQHGKQINSFYPCNHVDLQSKDYIARFNSIQSGECTLFENGTTGEVRVTSQDLRIHPEFICNAGSISWNLRFDRKIGFLPYTKTKNVSWYSYGAYSVFAGKINFDGEEYEVVPAKSYGYAEKKWGTDYNSPLFHLHSSNLISSITGKPMQNSCVVVEGEFAGKIAIYTYIENKCIEFEVSRKRRDDVTFECSEMPEDEDGVKLHWTCSAHNKKYVLDIDVYCKTQAMSLRDYESPEGSRKLLKILGGCMGTGTVRLYQKNHKELELLNEARIANCVCEYGNMEYPEK